MLKLGLTLIFNLAILQYVTGVCNVCNDNGVACITEKEFHTCVGGKPNTSIKFTCLGENEICTKNARVCMDKTLDTASPACGDISNCGKCEGKENDGKYTCTSRTTFTMCSEGELTHIRVTCPKNQMCDVGLAKQGQYPCVPNCRESQIEFCDLYDAIDVPASTTVASETTVVTTTTIFSPTPPSLITTQNPGKSFCSQQSVVGRYPYPNDTTCKNYVYCFRKGGSMKTTLYKCLSDLYFNPSTRICGNVKPNGCI